MRAAAATLAGPSASGDASAVPDSTPWAASPTAPSTTVRASPPPKTEGGSTVDAIDAASSACAGLQPSDALSSALTGSIVQLRN